MRSQALDNIDSKVACTKGCVATCFDEQPLTVNRLDNALLLVVADGEVDLVSGCATTANVDIDVS